MVFICGVVAVGFGVFMSMKYCKPSKTQDNSTGASKFAEHLKKIFSLKIFEFFFFEETSTKVGPK